MIAKTAAACFLICSIFLGGCSIDQQFVSAVDDAWSVIGPEYCEYVRNDSKLDEVQKNIRLQTAKLLTETLEEAKKQQ